MGLDDLKKQIVAAFESDGVDCKKVTYDKAIESLSAINCELKFMILYHVRKFDLLKPTDLLMEQFRILTANGISCELDYNFATAIKTKLALLGYVKNRPRPEMANDK